MKKILSRIAAAVVVLIVAGIVVVFFSLNSLVKAGFEKVGPKLTQVEMKLKSANLSPFSGKGQLSGLFVGNPSGYKTPSAIQVGDIKVDIKPGSVLSGTIVVESVAIQAPEITLEGSLSGNNLSKILDNLNTAVGSDSTAKTDKKSEKKFIVKDVVVQGAKVNLSITGFGGKALPVPVPEVHLQNIGVKENGVTAAEMSKQILEALLANVGKAAGGAVANVGKGVEDAGKGALDQAGKATQGLKGLFK